VYYKLEDKIHKNLVEPKDEDFLLLTMNDYQKSMFEKFGNVVIFIDEAHGINSTFDSLGLHSDFIFNLTTILVHDDMRERFPC